MDRQVQDYGSKSEVFEPISSNNAKQRTSLIEWLNGLLPDHSLPINASDEELRAFLVDGSVLCRILNKLKPECGAQNVGTFLSAMDEMGLPRFEVADLEKGCMKMVLDCLLTLQTHVMLRYNNNGINDTRSRLKLLGRLGSADATLKDEPAAAYRSISSPPFGEDRRSRSLRGGGGGGGLRSPRLADLPAARISEMMKSNSLDNAPTQSLLSVVNGILDESVEMKNGEIPHRVACLLRKVVQEIERRICTQAEHLRTQNNLFKAREDKYQSRIRVLEALATGTSEETQIVMNQLQQIKSDKNKIEDKKIKVEDHDTASRLLSEKDELHKEITSLKQELERIRKEESSKMKHKDEVIQEISSLKQELGRVRRSSEEESSKGEVIQEISNLRQEIKEKDDLNQEITYLKGEKYGLNQEMENLKKELEIARRSINEVESSAKIEGTKEANHEMENLRQEIARLKKEVERVRSEEESLRKMKDEEISVLKKEVEIGRRSSEEESSKLIEEMNGELRKLREEVKEKVGLNAEVESKLKEARKRVKEMEAASESKSEWWNKQQNNYDISREFQLGALEELRFVCKTIREEVASTQNGYSEEFSNIGSKIKILGDAAKNYYPLLAENRKMHNELQELKGNIRVYCRVRPLLGGQKGKQSIVESIGENGEIVVANPAKPGKEGRRPFNFDKVYGPTSTQAQVYADTQPLIQSVLDGYNVCIFAYGQTGSGKTYTMTGPDGASEQEWGVNYRALNDLFRISDSREGVFKYEVSVQMVEIYNEQVRDLLSNDGQKKLGIMSTSQPHGLAVPDASIQVVGSTKDVLKLMETGLNNRAKSSTAMNERSSRSHSIVSVHTRGSDVKTGSTLRGSLHLVDLAGSERVDRSEVTGDRLKEAQHINKSLSALGDVIFALAQKSAHVPYRNSKLTQVLQSSLGGRAKTLMFVQLNPDATSFGETISTLKFAERVSGVELGAAKSSKDGRDVRDLMDQVASLKDTIAKKDEEIEALQLVKDPKSGGTVEKRSTSTLRN
ncbi:hypothetical protein ACS0TY_030583 [Phlomoides rotata]